ncbi:MAG: hypothetical protein IJT73_11750 [Selenomonadaceae bacterium]|nr:hypothetical protein [Selenomonadaceae bacterium]
MKPFVKILTALIICGSLLTLNCENVQAAEAADSLTNSIEIQESARHRRPPPPPRHHDKYRSPRHHDDFFPPPPPPPPPHPHGGHHHPRW